MKGLKFKALLSAISVAVLLLCAFVPAGKISQKPVTVDENIPTLVTAAANEVVFAEQNENTVTDSKAKIVAEPDEEWLKARFLGMLNLNYCYNNSLNNVDSLAKCAAWSLADFSQDEIGYGRCVSAYLVEGFVESFYGVDIDAEDLVDDQAPKGYISLPKMEKETGCHSIVSFEKTADGYELLTCFYGYAGGEEYDTCLVKSKFVENANSEFGFNLVFCEVL